MTFAGEVTEAERHEMSLSLLSKTCEIEPKLLRIARSIVRCPCLAEDIVQDAYVKLLANGTGIRVLSSEAFLKRVVRNVAIDRMRQIKLERRLFTCDEKTVLRLAAASACPETQLHDGQALRIVELTMAGLPERIRNVFYLHRVEGLEQSQIAKHLGVSKASICSYVGRADKECREALEKAGRLT